MERELEDTGGISSRRLKSLEGQSTQPNSLFGEYYARENSSVFCVYLWPDSSDISHLLMIGRILSHCSSADSQTCKNSVFSLIAFSAPSSVILDGKNCKVLEYWIESKTEKLFQTNRKSIPREEKLKQRLLSDLMEKR